MCHSYRCPTRWYEPFGESLSRLKIDGKNDVWIYTFELVIRLSRVNCWPFFHCFTRRSSDCWNCWPLCLAPPFFSTVMHSWMPRQQPPFPVKLKRIPAAILTWTGNRTCFTGVVTSFWFLGEVQLCTEFIWTLIAVDRVDVNAGRRA